MNIIERKEKEVWAGNSGFRSFLCRVWVSEDEKRPKTDKTKTPPAFMDQGFWGLELMAGFEPATSSLPRMRSTD